MWSQIEPRGYERSVDPVALIRSVMMAFLTAAPSLESLASRYGQWLKTTRKSTLSYALRRASSLRMAQALLARLADGAPPKCGELVALDSMPLTLPATRRHGCKKINRATVGGGILWAFRLQAARGLCPVKILKLISGPWHDTQTIADVQLAANGPIYLMDRGFWAIDLVRQWLSQQVHFIVRIKKEQFKYTLLETRGPARPAPNDVWIKVDGLAQLGGPQRKDKPVVRLVVALLSDGSDLILASDQLAWSAEQILAAYNQRCQIEGFHRFLKDTLGLAHLYSFNQSGIFFLAHVAVLTALLLFFGAATVYRATVETMKRAFEALRRAIGRETRWKRNMTSRPKYKKRKRTMKRTKNH